jgi:hypothetical protein
VKIIIGCRRAGIVQTYEGDSKERETHVRLQSLLGDSSVEGLFVKRGNAGEPIYLRGDPQKHGNR